MLIHCSHGFSVQDGIVQVMKYVIFIEVECRKERGAWKEVERVMRRCINTANYTTHNHSKAETN